jgi:hypothetical protein
VAHTCNPSYSGGRDQIGSQFEASRANSSARPYLEKTLHKKGLVEWLKVHALSSSLSTTKKKERKKIILRADESIREVDSTEQF